MTSPDGPWPTLRPRYGQKRVSSRGLLRGDQRGDDAPRDGDAAADLTERWREGQAGQVGAAATAGLVPDPVQVRADRADADVQFGGDLRVGPAPGDQDDQLSLPGAELSRPRRRGTGLRAGISSWTLARIGG